MGAQPRTNRAARGGTRQARNSNGRRGRRLSKAKDKELLCEGKWHKLIRWMPSSMGFLPSSQVKRLGFLSIAFGNGIRIGYLKVCSGTDPVSLPARFSTFNTAQNPANCRIVLSSERHFLQSFTKPETPDEASTISLFCKTLNSRNLNLQG